MTQDGSKKAANRRACNEAEPGGSLGWDGGATAEQAARQHKTNGSITYKQSGKTKKERAGAFAPALFD